MKNLKAVLLTIIQYVTLGIMLYSNKWIVDNPVLMFIQFFGIFIAIWAILEMAKSKLNISPVPRSGSVLIQSGPYKIVRHPMYLSLLLTITPMILTDISTFNIIVFSIFIINLVMKMLYEESLLHKYFEDYAAYSKKSWRLLPLVY